ncbi:MAG: acyl-CoA dehydrogenase family protein [Anaerolineales bacterium]|nr:acyl-CoA dehydrogenase family protein [Anaerolineales bacterium]
MNFGWTPEQLDLRRRVITFAETWLNGDIVARDRDGEFPREAWNACGTFGLLGLNVPHAYGGGEHDPLTIIAALEALGYGCRDNGLTFAVCAQVTSLLPTFIDFASEAHKQRFLPGLSRGTIIACDAMTEPETGSDAFAMRTTAVKDVDDYVLNGCKTYLTFAPVADVYLVYALTKPGAGAWGVSLFLIERGTPGLEIGPVKPKLGLRTVPMGEITLRDVRVPAANRIGPEGAGASMFNAAQEWERAGVLAFQIGRMEKQLEECVAFARERKAFGQSIGKFQSISNRIAEMKLRLETARLLTYRAAWRKSRGEPAMLDAALAKLHLSEAFVESSLDAIRIHGGRGYVTEEEIERDLRDAIGGPIYGGTSDIQRNIIARILGLPA